MNKIAQEKRPPENRPGWGPFPPTGTPGKYGHPPRANIGGTAKTEQDLRIEMPFNALRDFEAAELEKLKSKKE